MTFGTRPSPSISRFNIEPSITPDLLHLNTLGTPQKPGTAELLEKWKDQLTAISRGEIKNLQVRISREKLERALQANLAVQATAMVLQCGSASGPSLGTPVDILGPLAALTRSVDLLQAEKGIVVIGDAIHKFATPAVMNDSQRKGFCRIAAAQFTLVQKLKSHGAGLEPVLAEDLMASKDFREVVRDLERAGAQKLAHPWAFYTAALAETVRRMYGATVQMGWTSFNSADSHAAVARGESASQRAYTKGCDRAAHEILEKFGSSDVGFLYHQPGRTLWKEQPTAAPDHVSLLERHGQVLTRDGEPYLARLLLSTPDAELAQTIVPLLEGRPVGPETRSIVERTQYYWNFISNLQAALPQLGLVSQDADAALKLAGRVLQDYEHELSDDHLGGRAREALERAAFAAEVAQHNVRASTIQESIHGIWDHLGVETHLKDAATPTAVVSKRPKARETLSFSIDAASEDQLEAFAFGPRSRALRTAA